MCFYTKKKESYIDHTSEYSVTRKTLYSFPGNRRTQIHDSILVEMNVLSFLFLCFLPFVCFFIVVSGREGFRLNLSLYKSYRKDNLGVGWGTGMNVEINKVLTSHFKMCSVEFSLFFFQY